MSLVADAPATLPVALPSTLPSATVTESAPRTLTGRLRRSVHRLTSFGAIGVVAFLVDLAAYNALRSTVLSDAPIWAKVVAAAVSMTVAWLGNRHITYRDHRSAHPVRAGLLFIAVNLLGLFIATACLFVSHYLLGYTSQLADNISGNVIGLMLATAFRFASYQLVVFRTPSTTPDAPAELGATELELGLRIRPPHWGALGGPSTHTIR